MHSFIFFQKVFEICSEKEGVVPISTVEKMLVALGFKDLQPYDIARSPEKIGITASPNSQQEITLDEFIHLSSSFFRKRNKDEEIDQLFEMFDEEGKGAISFGNLKRISQEVGLKIRDDILHEMITEADKDNDGVLNASEFRNVIKRNNNYF
jgi:Ca2+-binding EF-hand superfamily protein